MDPIFQQTILAALKPALVLLALPFLVEGGMSLVRSPRFRGWFAEKSQPAVALERLNPELYHRIDGLEVPKPDGTGTTRVDHVVISRFGIFVIEAEEMAGCISGGEKEPFWTLTAGAKQSRFENPLWKNSGHVWALQEYLGLRVGAFHSVVFLSGECAFQTPVPADVLTRGLCRFVEGFKLPVLSAEEVQCAVERLRELGYEPSLRAALDSSASGLANSELVERQAA